LEFVIGALVARYCAINLGWAQALFQEDPLGPIR
jgi:hypothetical protein